MPAPIRRSLAVLVTAVALAGCGSGPTAQVTSGAFTVTLDDYLIRPQHIRVASAGQLTVTVHNIGRLGHTFRIRSANHVVLAVTTIPPGGTRTRTFRLAPGHYTTFCALANHEELGMHGTLVVH